MNDKEKMIFGLYKDKPVISAKNFKSKIKTEGVNAYKIYTNIINYQIEKYGNSLRETVERLSWETKKKLCRRATQRKYYRRTYEKKNR